MLRFLSYVVVCSSIIIAGCSTYAVPRYASNADNVVTLRNLGGAKISVGQFTATKAGEREIMCRGVGPIKTPDGETFSEFIRKSLLAELKFANIHDDTSNVVLTGHLHSADFSSMGGTWNLELSLRSSNGRSMQVREQYSYTTSFVGETACNQTAQALMPAVQNLIGRIVGAPEFVALVGK